MRQDQVRAVEGHLVVGEEVDVERARTPAPLAGAVADAVLTTFPRVASVRVTVHKPHAPIAAIFNDVGVTILRTRGR